MRSFDEILDQCLRDIESGQATIDECLSRYPDQAEALRPLLETALAVRSVPPVEPSAAFQAAAPTRLVNLIAARQRAAAQSGVRAAVGRFRRGWAHFIVRVAAVVVVASCLLAGTAYAARDSLPDSPLYPVKLTVERVQVATTPSDVRRARVFISVMDQRAKETTTMIRSSKLKQAHQTNQNYIHTLKEAETIIERIPADRPEGQMLLVYMRKQLLAQQAIYQKALVNGLDQAKPFIQLTLAQIQSTLAKINARLATEKSLFAPLPAFYRTIS